jgi:uncharacterized protein (DUF305 family)
MLTQHQPFTLTRSKRSRRSVGALALGLTLVLTTAACGDSDSSDSMSRPSTTEHNQADVAFATDMIQHHAQALSMVDLTLDRALDPQVQAMAEAVRDAQGPEIETMTEQQDGQYQPAITLAGDIVVAQEAEIEKMKSLLGS